MQETRKIASVKEILEDVRNSGATSVEDQLKLLAEKFVIAAQAIDPTIEGSWCGYDGERFNRLFHVHLERAGSPFVRQ
jgi:hypothetical protein